MTRVEDESFRFTMSIKDGELELTLYLINDFHEGVRIARKNHETGDYEEAGFTATQCCNIEDSLLDKYIEQN